MAPHLSLSRPDGASVCGCITLQTGGKVPRETELKARNNRQPFSAVFRKIKSELNSFKINTNLKSCVFRNTLNTSTVLAVSTAVVFACPHRALTCLRARLTAWGGHPASCSRRSWQRRYFSSAPVSATRLSARRDDAVPSKGDADSLLWLCTECGRVSDRSPFSRRPASRPERLVRHDSERN